MNNYGYGKFTLHAGDPIGKIPIWALDRKCVPWAGPGRARCKHRDVPESEPV